MQVLSTYRAVTFTPRAAANVACSAVSPASQAELGRRCEIDRSYVVQAINELADGGLVIRATDPNHRRRNTITITEAGIRRLHRLGKTLEGDQETLLAPLSPDERRQLVELLARVLDHHAHG